MDKKKLTEQTGSHGMYEIIAKKRDGSELNRDEIRFFIRDYVNGSIPDYQASALLMAIYLNGLNSRLPSLYKRSRYSHLFYYLPAISA